MDMLVEQTHDMDALGITPKGNKPIRFTDTRIDEQVGRRGGGAGEVTIGIK